MTTTMSARLTRSAVSISTSRGKCGNAYWPIHHARPITEGTHEQRLLEDESADDAVAGTDELEQRDVADLVERERVDDERDDDGGDDDEQDAEEAELAARLVHHAGEQQVLLLLGGIDGDVRPGAQRAADGGFIGTGLQRDEHGADLRRGERGNAAGQPGGALQQQGLEPAEIDAFHPRPARGAFEAHGLSGLVELDGHRIADGEEGESVAAGADHAAGEADDFIDILAQTDAAAERQLQRLVGDHFIMRLPQRATGDERHPVAAVLRPGKPLHDHAQRLALVLALDRVGDEAARLRHAGHGPHAVFEIGRECGRFPRTVRACCPARSTGRHPRDPPAGWPRG